MVIADPPYLGRAQRWYGEGRGHGGGRGRSDFHPEAQRWDSPRAHVELLDRLDAEADGWAVALCPDSLHLYLSHAPAGVRVATWVRGNAMSSGSRIRSVWEPVLLKVPEGRVAHSTGDPVDDVLVAGIGSGGFAGRKPQVWTHWVLRMLGYDPELDDVVDLFPGSGAVTAAIAAYVPHEVRDGRRRAAPAAEAQRLRRSARAANDRRAAVLAALRAGGSVRSVAASAGVSTNTVQRWKREANSGALH